MTVDRETYERARREEFLRRADALPAVEQFRRGLLTVGELADRLRQTAGMFAPEPDPSTRGGQPSLTIIAAPVSSGPEHRFVLEKAREIAGVLSILHGLAFDVDVVEGTFSSPLSGDNVLGLGAGTRP